MKARNGAQLGGRAKETRHAARGWRAAFAVAAGCIASVASGQQFNQLPRDLQGIKLQDKLGASVPKEIALRDSTGRDVPLAEIFNGEKPVVLVLAYFSCPLICPRVISSFDDALNQIDYTLGDQYKAVIISFDPRDTSGDAAQEKAHFLARYTKAAGPSVEKGLYVLTGEARETQMVADAVGYPYKYLPESGEFSHVAVVFILTPDGKVARYLTGLEYDPKDVRRGILDASNGVLGTFSDILPTFCYQWNPEKGSYQLEAYRVMQVAGVASTVLLGGFLAVLWSGERRRRRKRVAADEAGESGPVVPGEQARQIQRVETRGQSRGQPAGEGLR